MGCADPTQPSPAPLLKHRPTTTGAKQDRGCGRRHQHKIGSTSTPALPLAWRMPSDGIYPTDLTPAQPSTGHIGGCGPELTELLGAPVGSTGHGLSHPQDTTQKLAPLTGWPLTSSERTGCSDPLHPAVVIFFSSNLFATVPITRDIAVARTWLEWMKPEVLTRHKKGP